MQSLFDSYVPGTRFDVALGKKLETELKDFLSRMVNMTDSMDEEQLKRITRCIKKAFEAVVIMKDTQSGEYLDKKEKAFNSNLSVLQRLIDTRIEVIDEADHKRVLTNALKSLQTNTPQMVQATRAVVNDAHDGNLARQADVVRALLTAISEIASIIKLPPPKSRGGLDHEVIINENLDHLRDAVSSGSASAAADAARRIADEINKMGQEEPDPNLDDEEARRRAREALEAAARGLKGLVGGLVLASKNAIQNPNDAAQKKNLDKAIDDIRDKVHTVRKDYDTITTGLKGSGMIDAAAQAAKELEELFKS